MKAKLVRIGNSRGVRIPKPLLEQAGLKDEVELRVVEGGLLIRGIAVPRAGWAEAAEKVRERGEKAFMDTAIATDFDESEWNW